MSLGLLNSMQGDFLRAVAQQCGSLACRAEGKVCTLARRKGCPGMPSAPRHTAGLPGPALPVLGYLALQRCKGGRVRSLASPLLSRATEKESSVPRAVASVRETDTCMLQPLNGISGCFSNVPQDLVAISDLSTRWHQNRGWTVSKTELN